jgi:hypothetical protein
MAWSMRQAAKAAHHDYSGDEQWHRIAIEMGRGPTSVASDRPNILGRKDDGMLASMRSRPRNHGAAGRAGPGLGS